MKAMRTNKSNTPTRELLIVLLKRAVHMLESDNDFTEGRTIWLTDEEKEEYGTRYLEQPYSPSQLFHMLKLIRSESLSFEKECKGIKESRWRS